MKITNRFDLLKWQDDKVNHNQFKVGNPDIVHADEVARFKAKIQKDPNPFATESKDNYRKYHFNKEH